VQDAAIGGLRQTDARLKRLGEPRAVEPGLFGTIDYIAPEQIRGDDVDGRADVYSLGCLLYECLIGEPPFRRPTDAAALFAHLEEEPPTPPGLEDVIGRALAKEPGDRYGSCAELVDAAREGLGLGESPPRWWRARVALALAGAALIAVALAVYLVVRGGGAAQTTTGGSVVRIDARTNRVAARVAVGNNPSAVTADASGVWVANHDDGSVWRIDAHSDGVILRSSAHGVPADLGIVPAKTIASSPSTPGSAVVVNGPVDPNIVEIDAATGTPSIFSLRGSGPNFGMSGSPAGAGTPRVATDPSGIWVARPDRQVGRFDDNAGRLVHPLFIAPPRDERGSDSYFSGIAVGDRGVWVLGYPNDPRLWRIDSTTGKLAATIPLPFYPTDVAVGNGAVWVTSELGDTLARISPSTNQITAAVPAGKGASAVAVGGGSVWVADQVSRAITRIDPRTLGVIDTIKLDSTPVDLAVGDGVVWVAAQRS
jgi:streptogramin lyase